VFEVDEAVLPLAISRLKPKAIAITNLFRDQLDRYGEVDTVRRLWAEAIARLSPATTLVLNADDPAVASLGQAAPGPVLYFGVEDGTLGEQGPEDAADSLYCHRCGSPFSYRRYFYAHLGHYQCYACETARPGPQVAAGEVRFRGFAGTDFRLATPQGSRSVSLALSGLYNVYNALAAAALGLSLEQPLPTVVEALEGFSAAFGRMERVCIEGRQVFLVLVKNPTGFNQVLRTVSLEPGPKNLLLVLNDQIADGRDISWVWDVDFQHLQGQMGAVLVSGLRAEEMALRLKYAGFAVTPDCVERDLARALDKILMATPLGGTLYILPTYTAMLSLQRLLARRGWLQPYWEEG
jgi:UDP-N-acetylmuramyl tripeptide synthase